MKAILMCMFFVPFIFFSQLSGTFTDQQTKEPLFGVKIKSLEGKTAITDTSGYFQVSVQSYPIKLIASLNEYVTDTILVEKQGFFSFTLSPIIQSMESVIVVASKRKQSVEEVPISIEIIKAELINNKGLVDLEQAVDQSPGVYAMDGQVSIRGGSGFSYGAGSRVMLLWNGIPMLSGDAGDTKWNAFPLDQASQIEILKGASSVLYGSGALNGIISLTEREPSLEGETKVKIQSGIYGDPKRESLRWWSKNPMNYLFEGSYSKMYKKIGFSIAATGFTNDGYRKGETEDRARITGSVIYNPLQSKKLKMGIGYNIQTQKTGNFIIWQSDSLAYIPFGGADTSNAASTLTYNRGHRISIDPYIKFTDKYQNKHNLKTRVYYIENNNLNNLAQSSNSSVYFADYQFQKSWTNKTVVTFGVTDVYTKVNSSLFGDHYSNNASLYGQYERKFGKLDLTAGLRFEYYEQDHIQGDSDFYFGKDTSKAVKIPVYPIARIGLHYPLTKYTHLRASLGQGVRYPSVAERYTYTSVGALNIFPNAALKPEIGWAAEFGIKQGVKIADWKGFFDVAAFINQYRNMMEFTFGYFPPQGVVISIDPTNPNYIGNFFGFQSQNAENARISGLDFSFNGQGKIKKVEITTLIGYTYMNPISLNDDSLYLSNFSDSGSNILKYRFKHLAKGDVELTWRNISFGTSLRYNSFMNNIDRIFEDGFIGTEILPGLKKYRRENNKGNLIVDLRLGYKFLKKYRVGFVINNLMNLEYMTRPGDIQAPRNFVLQLQANF